MKTKDARVKKPRTIRAKCDTKKTPLETSPSSWESMAKPRTEATPEEREWWEKLRKLCKSMPVGLQIFAYPGSFYALDSQNHALGERDTEIFVPLDIECIDVDCDGGDCNWE
jgi:hypothetical protein